MAQDNFEHGPVAARRIPANEYEQSFLRDLKAQKKVAAVDESWTTEQLRGLPPGVKYLLYPNGDLQRL
jgi:hypothetical protein